MPILKDIRDKQSTTRYKSGNEDQRLLTASARNAKEKEFFEQKKKREAERKAAQERIKKAQSALASRNSGAGVGSSVNSDKGNSPVTRAAMNAPSGSDNVSRAGDGGHNRATDNKGKQPRSGNLGGGSSSFSAMVAALARDNERKTGTGGHNRAGENDSRGHRFSASAQRSSALPSSSLSNELDFSDDDKNKSWSQMLEDLQSQRRKPDSKDNTVVKEDTRTYNLWDDILWREEQDAMVYEDMKNGWKPNGDVIGTGRRAYVDDVMSEWDEFTQGQISIPDIYEHDGIGIRKTSDIVKPIDVTLAKDVPGTAIGTILSIPTYGLSPVIGVPATFALSLAGNKLGDVLEPSLISEGPAETMEVIIRSDSEKRYIIYTATKYSEGGMDLQITSIPDGGTGEGFISHEYYPYNDFKGE